MMKTLPVLANRTVRLVVCSLIYQIIWFAAIYSAGGADRILLGPAAVTIGLGLQIVLYRAYIKRVLLMMCVSLLTGVIVDGGLVFAGVLVPARHVLVSPLPPVWLLSLWAAFGVYLAIGLELMYGRPRMAAFAGFFGGALAYRGGVPFGALTLGSRPWVSLLVVGLVWAVVFPLLIRLAARMIVVHDQPNPISVKRVVVALIVVIGLAHPIDSQALEGDGRLFSDALTLHDVRLVRRGVGRLRRWFIKGCDIALYTRPSTTLETLFSGAPKALAFYYYVKIGGEQFAKAADETLQQNLSEAQYKAFKPQIEQMGNLFVDVEPKDRYRLYFVPGKGTTLELNGKRRGVIPGDEFADIYFQIWLGTEPIDDALYEGLTGKME